MKLTQVELRAKFKHRNQKEFNKESWCVSELYWSFLKDYDTEKTQKCVIRLDDDWGAELYKLTDHSNVIQVNINFNFSRYFELSNKDKKKRQLESLHKGMMKMAEIKKWNTDPLLDAYNECLKKDLKYEFFIFNKAKASPSRKLYINFWCEWGIDLCKLYWMIYDKNQKIQARELLIEKEAFWGEFVYYIKPKWIDNETVIVESKQRVNELFTINIGNYKIKTTT